MSYFTHAFEAEIERFGVGKVRQVFYKVLFLPPGLEAELPFNEYPRLRVEGEIAEMSLRCAFIPAGDGRRYVIVPPDLCKNTGVDLGDVVEFRFRVDDQDFVDVPAPLEEAIQAAPALADIWSNLTAGKKRMFAHHVGSAKSEKTIAKRVAETLDALALGMNLRDFKNLRR